MRKIKICVVGAGNWGFNHIKTLNSLDINVGCVDNNPKKLKKIKSDFKKINYFNSIKESFEKNYDGYIISTPPSTHTKIAIEILSKSKPVLIEKPLALSVSEAKEIKSVAKKFNVSIVVGHLLLFHPAIIKIKSMIDNGRLGKIQYIYSNRLNLGKVRKEENVFWSFAPHDIALFQYFTNSFPKNIFSMGGDFLQKNVHDTTITYLKYPDNVQGHIYVSWLHPFKEHRLVIIGSRGSLHFEDSANNKPLLFYEKDKDQKIDTFSLKNKISKKINYEKSLPLENEIKHFIDVVNGEQKIKSNVDDGIDVVKILEKASTSIT